MQKRRVHADRQVALGPGAYGNKGSWPLRHRLLAIDNCIDRGVQGGTPEASTFVWCSARRRHQQAPRSAPSTSSYILLLPCPCYPAYPPYKDPSFKPFTCTLSTLAARRSAGKEQLPGDQYVINTCRQIEHTGNTVLNTTLQLSPGRRPARCRPTLLLNFTRCNKTVMSC